MPFDAATKQLDNIHAAQRCVEEWLSFLSTLDPEDERFSPSLLSFREAIKLRNRLERKFAVARAA